MRDGPKFLREGEECERDREMQTDPVFLRLRRGSMTCFIKSR